MQRWKNSTNHVFPVVLFNSVEVDVHVEKKSCQITFQSLKYFPFTCYHGNSH